MGTGSQVSADFMADECYRLELCGLSGKAARWIDFLNQLTSRSDLQLLTLLPLRNLVSLYRLVEYENRFCPACYAEDERAGREKYDRLLWTIRCVTACPKHECRLIFEPKAKGHRPLPFTIPGISRIDGSSLARFTSTKASSYEVAVAALVSELVEEITRMTARKKISLISVFLMHATDSLFNGNRAALAHHLGLSKSQVHGWVRDGIVPSLAGLARIAYAFECTMTDVILGRKVSLTLRRGYNSSRGLFALARISGHKTPRCELLASLLTFMKRNPDACAQDAARHLKLAPKFLRENFPEQNKALVIAGRLYRQRIAQERRDAKDEAYGKSYRALSGSGTYPSRRKVAKRLKLLKVPLTFADEKRAKKKADAAYGIEKRVRGV